MSKSRIEWTQEALEESSLSSPVSFSMAFHAKWNYVEPMTLGIT